MVPIFRDESSLHDDLIRGIRVGKGAFFQDRLENRR